MGARIPAGSPTANARSGWRVLYKQYVPRDLVRDEGMVSIKNALRSADGKKSLDGIVARQGPPLRQALERVYDARCPLSSPGSSRG